jgi:hypothetical protein
MHAAHSVLVRDLKSLVAADALGFSRGNGVALSLGSEGGSLQLLLLLFCRELRALLRRSDRDGLYIAGRFASVPAASDSDLRYRNFGSA